MPTKSKRFVVVTTEHRGVFGGFLPASEDDNSKTLTLTECQICVYWSADVKGVLGLAATGPSKDCRVSPAVPKMTLQGVTSVMDCTAEAAKAWQDRPWG